FLAEQHRVHFGEDADSFGKDNEIIIKGPDGRKVTAHLGFLQISHRYEISLTLQRALLRISEESELRQGNMEIPNINCRFKNICNEQKEIKLTVELLAYKEKLLKEELSLEISSGGPDIILVIMARVLGRGKGTPLLKNGIKCVAVELEDESEASDWQGFD
ncbi:UPF0687 protein, partial [Blattella germanica]